MKGFPVTVSERVFVYDTPTNMGKSFRGLSKLVSEQMKRKIMSGDMYLFMNKKRTYLKVFFFNKGGLCIFAKSLPSGTFDFDFDRCGKNEVLTIKEMSALIDVVSTKKLN